MLPKQVRCVRGTPKSRNNRKLYILICSYRVIGVGGSEWTTHEKRQMKKAVQITITEEQYEWLQKQPRGAFNLSQSVRELLEDIKDKQIEDVRRKQSDGT